MPSASESELKKLRNENLHLKEVVAQIRQDREREKRRKSNSIRQAGQFLSRLIAGKKLYSEIKLTWNDYSKWLRNGMSTPWPEHATRDLLAALIRRVLRIGIFAMIIALTPTAFLILQTQFLRKQNILIETQNRLAESNRRAALILELSEIMTEVDEELDQIESMLEQEYDDPRYQSLQGNFEKEWRNLQKSKRYSGGDRSPINWDSINIAEDKFLDNYAKFSLYPNQSLNQEVPILLPKLSDRLEGRIIAFNKSLKPYYYLNQNGELIQKALSPEKGQLLISLIESDLHLVDIVLKSNFQYADLQGAFIGKQSGVTKKEDGYGEIVQWMTLSNIDLKYANMNNTQNQVLHYQAADFSNASMRNANFSSCLISNSDALNVNFDSVTFDFTDFLNVEMSNSTFQNSSFWHCDLSQSSFHKTQLTNTKMEQCILPNLNTNDWKGGEFEVRIDNLSIDSCYTYNENWLKEYSKFDPIHAQKLVVKPINFLPENLQSLFKTEKDSRLVYLITEKQR